MTRVAITTTQDRADAATAPYRSRGMHPVVLPCIDVRAADEAALDLLRVAAEDADWVLVTSVRAVEAMWPDGLLPAARFAAVGEQTAAAVRASGGEVSLVGTGGARDITERLGSGSGRVVMPHADGADASTVALIESRGWTVVSGVAYTTTPVPPGNDEVDAVAFASPSAVTGWLMGRPLEGLVIGAIGETTAHALTAAGHDADAVADRPSHEHLATALAARLRGRITT